MLGATERNRSNGVAGEVKDGMKIASKPRKGNPGLAKAQSEAAGRRKSPGKRPQENYSDEEPDDEMWGAKKPAAALVTAGTARKGVPGTNAGTSRRSKAATSRGSSSIGSKSDDDWDKDDTANGGLRFGMAKLYQRMEIPGTAATRFAAAATQVYSSVEDWVNESGSLVAGLCVEHPALATALAPEAASQTYLAILGASGNFSVLHGLQRWPTGMRSSINNGRIIAFKGETVKDNQPPNVWRFEVDDNNVFRLQGFAEIEPSRVASFYHTPDKVDKNFYDEACPDDKGLWIGSLIPILMMWAALFLDYLNMGTAFRWVEDHVKSVEKAKRHIFWLLVMSLGYACHQKAGSKDSTNALSMPWKRIPRSQQALVTMTKMWSNGLDGDDSSGSDDRSKRMAPRGGAASTADDFDSMFGGGQRRPVYIPKTMLYQASKPALHRTGKMQGSAHEKAAEPPLAGVGTTFGMPGMDFATVMSAILQGQNENQLAIATASSANMIAFQTATA